MRYFGRVFRPPSEAYSLIVQVTYGCSHNTCAFCDMYKEKRFALRPMDEILEDFRLARQTYGHVERVFLADGDALVRKATRSEVKNGQRLEYLDSVDYARRMVVAATVEPDFTSKELCDAFGVVDPLLVPGKMLLSGEYNRLMQAISTLSAVEGSLLEGEVKN